MMMRQKKERKVSEDEVEGAESKDDLEFQVSFSECGDDLGNEWNRRI